MQRFLASISLFILLVVSMQLRAQSVYPQKYGDKVRLAAMIEMPKGYVSGICVMYNDGEEIKASIFNEFGISAIDFSYSLRKDKVKLLGVIKMLNKWYIRKMLKSDLRKLMHALQQGKTEYRNEKYKIDYKFSPIENDSEE